MKIKSKQLILLLSKAAEKVVSKSEAKYYAEETAETHLRKSLRGNPLKSAVSDLEACIKNNKKKISFSVNLPSFISIDFKSHGPLVYMKKIHDELEKRANKNGVAMVSFTNSKSMHTIHSWVQGLAKRNLLAIAVCNGGPAAVIPFNGTKGIFGTNPMAYGMPDGKGGIICIDMATSEAPYFEILDANDAKKSLREHIAVDQNGEFTTDPSKALDFSLSKTDPISNLVPIGGGYKGYYISYLMEIMTSGLIHMPSSPEMSTDFVAEEHGAFILAFSPKAFGSEKAFLKSIKTVNEKIKKQKPKKGENIRVPGEGNTKRFDNLKNKEIDVSDDLFEKINKLSK